MKISEAKIDPVKLEEGAWVANIPELEGVKFKVRGAGNRDWRKLQNRLYDSVPRNRRVGGRLDPKDQDNINAQCLLKTSLLDWDGLEEDDGSKIPFSRERAEELLSKPEYSKIRDGVLWAATFVAEQNKDEVEEDAGK